MTEAVKAMIGVCVKALIFSAAQDGGQV